jgi:hypothetical protein
MAWARKFPDPIELPGGRVLRSLSDARTFATNLPKHRDHAEEWQHAAELLMMASEYGGLWLQLARMAICKAIRAPVLD